MPISKTDNSLVLRLLDAGFWDIFDGAFIMEVRQAMWDCEGEEVVSLLKQRRDRLDELIEEAEL